MTKLFTLSTFLTFLTACGGSTSGENHVVTASSHAANDEFLFGGRRVANAAVYRNSAKMAPVSTTEDDAPPGRHQDIKIESLDPESVLNNQTDINWIDVDQLRPTQPSVGMGEVDARVDRIKEMSKEDRQQYLIDHAAEVIVGPDGKFYLIDGHHLSTMIDKLAKSKGIKDEIPYRIVADYSNLRMEDFWQRLTEKKRVYLKDKNGKSITVDDLPKSVKKLEDDPYRTLAWLLCEEGCYNSVDVPFQEFRWADFLRTQIDLNERSEKSWKRALRKAKELSQSPAASELPGYKIDSSIDAGQISEKNEKRLEIISDD